MTETTAYVLVGALGAFVGTAELVSRYRDAPTLALRSWPAIIYIVLNTLAAAGAYMLARVFGWTFEQGGSKDSAAAQLGLILVCGLSAMALFRSSLFIRRIGDRDVGVGPSSFLQVFLSAADAEVDRQRATARAAAVNRIIAGLDYEKTFNSLPPYCIALMQGLSDEAQRDLRRALELLNNDPMPREQKTRVLLLELINVVGMAVVETAVNSLGDGIRTAVVPGGGPVHP